MTEARRCAPESADSTGLFCEVCGEQCDSLLVADVVYEDKLMTAEICDHCFTHLPDGWALLPEEDV